jgi:hypothetical protein
MKPLFSDMRIREIRAAFGNDLWVLLVATIVALVWFWNAPILLTSDTPTYIDLAYTLETHILRPGALYWRLPMYPELLRLFHVVDLNSSIAGLVRFQVILGVLMSWLFYASVRRIDERWGFWLSIAFIVLCIPFLHSKSVMTEQIFMFGVILLMFGCVTYFMAAGWRTAAFAGLVIGYATAHLALTRPQGAYVPVVVLILLIALSWRRLWPLIPGAMVALLLFSGAAKIMTRIDPASHIAADRSDITSIDQSKTSGKMLLFTVYFASFYGVKMKVSPENGPATRAMKEQLVAEFVEHYWDSDELTPDMRARFAGSADLLVKDVFENPNPNYYFMIFHTLDKRLGPRAADRLILRSALEAMYAYPIDAMRFFLTRAVVAYLWPGNTAFPAREMFPENYFGPVLAAQLPSSVHVSKMERALHYLIRTAMELAVLLVILTAWFALKSPSRKTWIFLLVLAGYLNAAVIFGNFPLFRYAYYAIPLHMACALIGVCALLSRQNNGIRRFFSFSR